LKIITPIEAEKIKQRLAALLKKQIDLIKKPHKNTYIKGVRVIKDLFIVHAAGDITMETMENIIDEFTKAVDFKKIKKILIDMKGVKKVDFSAVASLVGFLKILNSRGKDSRIAFINISPRFKALLNISKTAALFKIYRSEEEAIAGMIKV